MTQDFDKKLRKLAELSVKFGLNIQPGQELFISAPSAAIELVRLVTEEAYKAGAAGVFPMFGDDAMALAKFEHGSQAAIEHAPEWLYEALAPRMASGNMARLAISGETPGLLAQQDPEKVARANAVHAKARQPLLEAIIGNNTNWNIIPFVTPGWAAKVFPNETLETAENKLWDLIFAAARVDQADPVAAWEGNFQELYRRRDVLNAHNFATLHFEGRGTDLRVGLAQGHKWVGGGQTLPSGVAYAPNLPTEEVFTMPDRARVDGRAVFSKPAAIGGSIVEGLVVEFAEGKATTITADVGQDVAQKYFTTDEGASRLGEVALVAKSSPIAASGVLYFDTLFDENAACHIAFGNAYAMNLNEGVDPKAAGMNNSQIHMDCMIGHDEIRVTGISRDGSKVVIMEAGEFVI